MSAHLGALVMIAYGMIGEATPLRRNCGELCGAACCQGQDAGMLLFPGEADLLSDIPDFRMYRIRYGGRRTWLLVCGDTCERARRPLACRIFPLAPYVGQDGAVTAVMDPRAQDMCPLYDGEPLDGEFVAAVEKAFVMLAKDPDMLEFLQRISRELEWLWEK